MQHISWSQHPSDHLLCLRLSNSDVGLQAASFQYTTCRQNRTHLWMEEATDIWWCLIFLRPCLISGTLHARCKHIYNPFIGMHMQQPSIWMDTITGQVLSEHKSTCMQSTDPMSYRHTEPRTHLGNNRWIRIRCWCWVWPRCELENLQSSQFSIKEIQCWSVTLLNTQAWNNSCAWSPHEVRGQPTREKFTLVTRVLSTSRPRETCQTDKHDGGSSSPTFISTPYI